MNPERSTPERLATYAAILRLIDARREHSGAPALGASIERFILRMQFGELGLT